jgi:hypothetical protein
MADYPDFFADGIAISAGPFGVTITFQLSQPGGDPGPHVEPNVTVGRVRVSPELARVLSKAITDTMAQQVTVQQPDAKVQH